MNIDDIGDLYVEHAGARYKCATLRVFQHFRQYVTNHEGWKEKFSGDVVTVWTKHSDPNGPGAGLNIVKVRALFPKVEPGTMYDALHDAKFRRSWDDKMVEGSNLIRLDARNDIGYYSAKFPFPLSDRDFLNQRFWMEFDNGEFIIMNRSVKHRDCPEKKDFIRAVSMITGYYLRPLDGGGTELLYITHSDIKGSVPHVLLNSATQKMTPSAMDRLRQNGENYAQWAKENHPSDFKPNWRTAKVPWDLAPAVKIVVPEKRDAPVASGSDGTPPKAVSPSSSGSAASLPVQLASMRTALGAAQADLDATLRVADLGPRNTDDARAAQLHLAAMYRAAEAVDAECFQSGVPPASVADYAARIRSAYQLAVASGHRSQADAE